MELRSTLGTQLSAPLGPANDASFWCRTQKSKSTLKHFWCMSWVTHFLLMRSLTQSFCHMIWIMYNMLTQVNVLAPISYEGCGIVCQSDTHLGDVCPCWTHCTSCLGSHGCVFTASHSFLVWHLRAVQGEYSIWPQPRSSTNKAFGFVLDLMFKLKCFSPTVSLVGNLKSSRWPPGCHNSFSDCGWGQCHLHCPTLINVSAYISDAGSLVKMKTMQFPMEWQVDGDHSFLTAVGRVVTSFWACRCWEWGIFLIITPGGQTTLHSRIVDRNPMPMHWVYASCIWTSFDICTSRGLSLWLLGWGALHLGTCWFFVHWVITDMFSYRTMSNIVQAHLNAVKMKKAQFWEELLMEWWYCHLGAVCWILT